VSLLMPIALVAVGAVAAAGQQAVMAPAFEVASKLRPMFRALIEVRGDSGTTASAARIGKGSGGDDRH